MFGNQFWVLPEDLCWFSLIFTCKICPTLQSYDRPADCKGILGLLETPWCTAWYKAFLICINITCPWIIYDRKIPAKSCSWCTSTQFVPKPWKYTIRLYQRILTIVSIVSRYQAKAADAPGLKDFSFDVSWKLYARPFLSSFSIIGSSLGTLLFAANMFSFVLTVCSFPCILHDK